MSLPTLLSGLCMSLALNEELLNPDLLGLVRVELDLLVSGSESLPFVLSSSLLCLLRFRFSLALALILDVLCGGSGTSLLSLASAAIRLFVLSTDAGMVALPLPPLTKGLDGDELTVLDLGLGVEAVEELAREERTLVLAEDLTGVLPGVLASLATLLLEGWRVSVDDADGFLGLDNLSVTAAAVALTFDLTLEAMVGLVGRLVVVEGSTEFLEVLLVDLRGDDAVWDLEGVSFSLENLDATDKTLLEGEDLEKRLVEDDLDVDEDLDVVLSGGMGGLSAVCICEMIT